MIHHFGKHHKRPSLFYIMIFMVVITLIAGLVGWVGLQNWYKRNLIPVASQSETVVFTIESGETLMDIAARLEAKKIIRSAEAFIWHVRQLEQNAVQAGTYALSGAMSSNDIARILVTGQVDSTLVTIPPGLRLDEIKEILLGADFSEQSIDAALAATYDHPLLRDKPRSASLEGYIYPESIQITANSTVQEVITQSFDVFSAALSEATRAGIRDQGLTLHEAITLASIIQEEVPDPQEQRRVAQVFLKRLSIDMPLGADPTFRYAAALTGQEAVPSLDNPYNTRIYTGLPPGPIANFTISALEAVANPVDDDYLYFVSGDDGTTHFSRTLEEHESNVARYCIDLCKL